MTTFALALSMTLLATQQAGPCESVRALSLPDTTITSVRLLPPGPYGSQSAGGRPVTGPMLPEHCRVTAVLKPSADSHIEMAIWLPTKNWNGKFLAVGNGSWAGSISLSAIAEGVSKGYAAGSTDTGHKGDSAEFAIGHPEKLIDFAYRSLHEMTVRSKDIIQKFYNRAPSRSYFDGCSTGGWQGLAEAQRYPADFDGLVAGAPVYRRIHLHAQELQKVLEVFKDENRYVPPDKVQMVAKAVTATCDADDGVVDGLINEPQTCRFEPKTLACRFWYLTGLPMAMLRLNVFWADPTRDLISLRPRDRASRISLLIQHAISWSSGAAGPCWFLNAPPTETPSRGPLSRVRRR